MSEFDSFFSSANMPYSLDAEQSVIGAILLDPNCINNETVSQLKPEYFYMPQHQAIFSAVFVMSQMSKPIDVVTILEELRSNGEYEKAGGKEYMLQIAQTVPSVGNVGAYAKVVLDKYLTRCLINAGHEIVSNAQDATVPAETQLDAAEQKIYDIRKGRENSDLVVLKDILATETLQRLTMLDDPEMREQMRGISCGFTGIDRLIGGLNKQDLIIIGARPGMGKTSLILNMARSIAVDSQRKVAFFSLEMSRDQLAQRLLSADAMIDVSRLRWGGLQSDEWDRISTATSKLYGAKLYVDETSALTVPQIKAKLRRNKPDVVFIDYLQLLQPVTKSENRVQQVSEMTRDLKVMAKELNVPVIVCSQLARATEARGKSHVPQLSDLRESGSIEQDADIVLLLYRPEYYADAGDGDDQAAATTVSDDAQCIVAKNRHGSTDKVPLRWDSRYTRFVTVEEEPAY